MAQGFPSDYLDQVTAALTAWEQIDPKLKVGDLTLTQVQEQVTAARAADQKVTDLNLQRTAAIDQRNDAFQDLRGVITRLRSLVRGVYGPDSPQYEQVGGTRASERKPRQSKAPPPASPKTG